ncbi:MAG: flavodoxin family protein [Oscillospiraceae bacterium]|nr:flavodoxin family protein [Oscillospiraceae bacterium]
MKVLLFNGSPHEKGCTYTALREVETTLNLRGIDTEIVQIGVKPIAGCIACAKCRDGNGCVFDSDGVNALAARLDEFDALVVGTPVYYAGPSSQATAFLDRLFYSGGAKLKGKPGAAVVSCRRGGASAAYDRLNKYFGIASMPIVTSQYWNQVHGNVPAEVLQDEEGLQTMRTLGENMAWLLRCIEAGKAAGITRPAPESPKRTNFIR